MTESTLWNKAICKLPNNNTNSHYINIKHTISNIKCYSDYFLFLLVELVKHVGMVELRVSHISLLSFRF